MRFIDFLFFATFAALDRTAILNFLRFGRWPNICLIISSTFFYEDNELIYNLFSQPTDIRFHPPGLRSIYKRSLMAIRLCRNTISLSHDFSLEPYLMPDHW